MSNNYKDYITMFLGGIGSFTAIAVALIIRSIKQSEVEAQMPPEYWIARKAETEADVEKHRISEESNERLVIDLREREETEKARKREFELNAPDEYWQSLAVAEREKTAREREITRRKIYEN